MRTRGVSGEGSRTHKIRAKPGKDEVYSEEKTEGWRVGICVRFAVRRRKKECQHEWKKTEGLIRVYYDCSLCGIKKEDFESKVNGER